MMEHIFLLPSDEELQFLEQKINYAFVNRALLREALQPPNRYNEDGNKSLALVGDKVLDLVIVTSGRDRNKTRGKHFGLAT
jgi:ribonuclease-3